MTAGARLTSHDVCAAVGSNKVRDYLAPGAMAAAYEDLAQFPFVANQDSYQDSAKFDLLRREPEARINLPDEFVAVSRRQSANLSHRGKSPFLADTSREFGEEGMRRPLREYVGRFGLRGTDHLASRIARIEKRNCQAKIEIGSEKQPC